MTTGTVLKGAGLHASDLNVAGFKVYRFSGARSPQQSHSRRDFYKIVFVTGKMTISYGDQTIEVNDTCLILINPRVPHSVIHHAERKGYACVFSEAFMAGRERKRLLQRSPLMRFGTMPVVYLSAEQAAFMTSLYQRMLTVYRGDYTQKAELLKTCIELVVHEAITIQPPPAESTQETAATRITHLFMELLERQFPIESADAPLRLRAPQDFAEGLSVHVNYLNRAVKAVTGKPTSVVIAERIMAEAKALLQHTDSGIADIAYSLGFEYPTYFNNYFKRMTGITPRSYRTGKV
jgi:AraC-like DNA-binding protein/quercetin dioxygenase-like cupin family protein